MYTACRLGSRILFSTIREVVATHTAYTIVVARRHFFLPDETHETEKEEERPQMHIML